MKKSGLPRTRNPFLRMLGGFVLKIMGWKIAGDFPKVPKAVLIAAPHTSNWDFLVGIAAKLYLELNISWLGKHTLFRKPFGFFFRWLGGIPVQRNASHGIVQQTVENFKQRDQFLLGLSPEGTRKRVDRWKTGFYQIALGANVPIIPVSFDFAKKIIQIGEVIIPTGSIELDFAKLQTFYSEFQGKNPENFNSKIAI